MVESRVQPEEVPVPAELFRDVLPAIDDLAELKVVLHVIALSSRSRHGRVPLSDLLAPPVVRSVAGPHSPEPGQQRVRTALRRAVANGSLLRMTIRDGGSTQMYFLPATRANRTLIDNLRQAGEEAARLLDLPLEAEVSLYRPNIFASYERHIGPLTPLIAEQLREAERSYPRAWIEEAIRTAVHYNRRNWRYIESILSRWEETGAPHGVSGRRS